MRTMPPTTGLGPPEAWGPVVFWLRWEIVIADGNRGAGVGAIRPCQCAVRREGVRFTRRRDSGDGGGGDAGAAGGGGPFE